MVRMCRKPGAAPNAAPASSRPSGAQAAAGGLFDIADDLLRQRVEVLVGQGLFDRLDQHLDRHRLSALANGSTLEDVEDIDAGDQLAVAALMIAPASTAFSTTKAKSRFTIWKGERSSAGLVRVAFRFGSGTASR